MITRMMMTDDTSIPHTRRSGRVVRSSLISLSDRQFIFEVSFCSRDLKQDALYADKVSLSCSGVSSISCSRDLKELLVVLQSAVASSLLKDELYRGLKHEF
jgi:hypothetical protein